MPISALRPTLHDWRIKARVIKKNELKSFISPFKSAPSKLLKITLMDSSREEIAAIFYGDDAEYFDERIEQGKVYGFSKGTIKEAKPAFNL